MARKVIRLYRLSGGGFLLLVGWRGRKGVGVGGTEVDWSERFYLHAKYRYPTFQRYTVRWMGMWE